MTLVQLLGECSVLSLWKRKEFLYPQPCSLRIQGQETSGSDLADTIDTRLSNYIILSIHSNALFSNIYILKEENDIYSSLMPWIFSNVFSQYFALWKAFIMLFFRAKNAFKKNTFLKVFLSWTVLNLSI